MRICLKILAIYMFEIILKLFLIFETSFKF